MDSTEGGVTVQIFVLAIGIIFILSVFVILFFILYQRRLLAQQMAQQEAEAAYQRDLLTNTINSQEAERNRIAKELHDEIGAMLTTTKLYSSQINPTLTPDQLEAVTHKMNHLFDDMIQNTRRISQDLRPVILEKLGLIEGVESLLKTITDTGLLTIRFEHQLDQSLDKSQELNLYRILQELINNTLKHAQASEVIITLRSKLDGGSLSYSDNGKGIDQDQLKFKRGIGLKNMESRVAVLGGKIDFLAVDKGISIQIEFPLLTTSESN